MTDIEFSKIVNRLRAAYPRAKMLNSDEEVKLWFDDIGSADYDKARRGVDAYVRYSPRKMYAPSVGEIHEAIQAVYSQDSKREMEIKDCFSRAVSSYPAFATENRAECEELFMQRVNDKAKNLVDALAVARRLEQYATDAGKEMDLGLRNYEPFYDLMRYDA